MALNDNAVFTASTGYVFQAAPGTAALTPAELAAFDPDVFGSPKYKLTRTAGEATVFKVGTKTVTVEADATANQIQAALEAVEDYGSGNIVANVEDDGSVTISVAKEKFNSESPMTVTGGGELELITEGSAWEPIGHTAAEELPEFGYEGGEKENRGTWQKKVLRQVSTETPVDYVTIKAQQFDIPTLELYYGKNVSKIPNVYGVDDPSASGIDKAFMIVLVDGDFRIAFSAAKATVARDESITLAADEFSTLPLRATFIKHPGRHLFEWTLPEA